MDKGEFLKEYLVNRKNTDCSKWDGLEAKFGDPDLLPLWIADMEFKTSKYVISAMIKRAEHGVFGYTQVPDEYYQTLSDWMETRYNFPVEKDWVRIITGCVTGLAYAINCYTRPGEACMILKPVYYPFFNVVTNNRRKLVDVDLDYADGSWSMNYEAIEQAIREQKVRLLLLCSPHNPAGKIWSEKELDRLFAICERYDVLIASDEIHQDLIVNRDKQFVPAAVVAGGKYRNRIITINSASKSFNLATLIHAHMIITDPELRDQYDVYASGINRTEVSVMGMAATMAAYQKGGEWLDALLEVVRDNYTYLKTELAGVIKVCEGLPS